MYTQLNIQKISFGLSAHKNLLRERHALNTASNPRLFVASADRDCNIR
jgi:hypothetical protein